MSSASSDYASCIVCRDACTADPLGTTEVYGDPRVTVEGVLRVRPRTRVALDRRDDELEVMRDVRLDGTRRALRGPRVQRSHDLLVLRFRLVGIVVREAK